MHTALDGATVLVTGGAGFVGSAIVDQLFEAGAAEVRVLDNLVRGRSANLRESEDRPGFKFVLGDIRDRDLVAKVTRGCDYVVHQAALRITRCAEEPRECVEVLCTGTLNVFMAAVAARVKKVVYASSASVYGAADTYPTAEDHHPYHNRTLYGAAKLFNEGIATTFFDSHGLPSVGLRYFNVYGPRMDVTGAYTEVFIRWLDAIDRGEPPVIHGDGSASMDFVYVADVARANLLALTAPVGCGVYNIASGTETSLLQLCQTLQQVSGAPHLQPSFQATRKVNPVPRRLADVSRAAHDLGFRAEVGFEDGVRRLADWRTAVRRPGLIPA